MKHIKKLIVLLICIPFWGLSQEKKIALIIDTINSNQEMKKFTVHYSYGSLYGLPLMKESTINDVNKLSENVFKFHGNFEVNSDTTKLQIPIDNNNGYLVITNFSSFKNGDSLRINKINMFDTDIRDTTYTIIKYFKSFSDSISSKAYKVKKTKKIDKKKKVIISPPKYLTLRINENEYTVLVEKTKLTNNPIMTFNGQKPANSQTPRIKFYGKSEKTNWKYVVFLSLKN